MFNARKLCAAALALCALLPTAAVAQSGPLSGKKVLLLTANTNNHGTHPQFAFYLATMQLGGVWLTPKLGALDINNTAPQYDYLKGDIEGADIVILVVDGNKTIKDYASKIEPLMMDGGGKKRSFILFAGSSASSVGGTTAAPVVFADTIKKVTGWKDAHLSHIPTSSYSIIPFKGNKALATIFTGINKDKNGNPVSDLHGNTYGVMQCVPKNSVIYGFNENRCARSRFDNSVAYYAPSPCYTTSGGVRSTLMEDLWDYRFISTNATPGTGLDDATATQLSDDAKILNQEWKEATIDTLHPDSASTVLVPQWQSNEGKGACIMFTIDESVFDQQGKPSANVGVPIDDDAYVPPPNPGANIQASIFDHWNQLKPMARAFLTAAVDKAACLQDKPAESVLAPAYNGADDSELAITTGGKVEGHISDNRDQETPDASATYDPVTNTCSQGEPCRSYGYKGQCCSKVLPDELPKSCSTPYMYCSETSISQAALSQPALPKNVCCSAEKTADNSKGNLCCDADNPQPTGAPGSQICCKAGQENKNGRCVTPPPMCPGPSAPTTGWPALLGLSALLPLLAARRRRK